MSNIFTHFKDFGERPELNKKFSDLNTDLQFIYHLIKNKIKDKSVLDYGCGSGYGTDFMAENTSKDVVGYDIDRDTIKYAKKFFAKEKNISFTTKLPNKKFDIITSFQVVEHLTKKQLIEYFTYISQHLTPNGHFYLTTVNQNITSYNLKTPTFSFHEIEYNPDSLKKLIQPYFSKVNIIGQIDKQVAKNVLDKKFSYDKVELLSTKQKIVRVLSQYKFIRNITKNTPQSIKNLLLGQVKRLIVDYQQTTNKTLVDNSYILIADCQVK